MDPVKESFMDGTVWLDGMVVQGKYHPIALISMLVLPMLCRESVPANTRTGTVVRTYPSQRYFYNVQYLCYLQPVIFTGILQILEAAVHSFAGGLANMMNAMKSYQHSMGTLLKHVKL